LPDSVYKFSYRSKKTIISDKGVILDNGGLDIYSNNSSDTIVIIPATKDKIISLTVNNISLEGNNDYLGVYYGIFSDSSDAEFIQNIYYSDILELISNDPTGAITLIFNSDEIYQSEGFVHILNHTDQQIRRS